MLRVRRCCRGAPSGWAAQQTPSGAASEPLEGPATSSVYQPGQVPIGMPVTGDSVTERSVPMCLSRWNAFMMSRSKSSRSASRTACSCSTKLLCSCSCSSITASAWMWAPPDSEARSTPEGPRRRRGGAPGWPSTLRRVSPIWGLARGESAHAATRSRTLATCCGSPSSLSVRRSGDSGSASWLLRMTAASRSLISSSPISVYLASALGVRKNTPTMMIATPSTNMPSCSAEYV
mmetsp:Transcript_15977/g.40853  ORF Transcript_15977/g.40853 Transcript_15977/m.40853 type:complete len:234 (-) Transcript_15977:342-1043(-)